MLLDREKCLHSVKPDERQDSTFFLVTKYLSGVNWGKLRSDINTLVERTKLEGNVKVAFRTDRNLKSFLIKSDLQNGEQPFKKGKKSLCGRKNCPVCKDKTYFNSGEIQCALKKVKLKSELGCKETSVVYLLSCKSCNLHYVGATSRELSTRFSEHLGKITNNSKEIQTVHLHFKTKKCIPSIGILEKVSDPEKLFQVEKWFIKKLRPFFNVKDATFIRVGEEYKRKEVDC